MVRRLVLRLVCVLSGLVLAVPGLWPVAVQAASAPTGGLDCNGYSPIQRPAKYPMICTDPKGYGGERFYDNGWYIGHDEPDMRFISTAAGSGNNMQWQFQLPTDPSAGKPPATTDTFELTPAIWLSMAMCDPLSFPQNACTPDSDANTGSGLSTDAGSAFMELQFYPPGFEPFIDQISCNHTQWCAALTIDSLECNFNFSCNNNCIEPVNFAFIQTDGVPTGPPGPGSANSSTLTPNDLTLFMNSGDTIVATLQDTASGLRVDLNDLTKGQTGFMVASSANGFQNTNKSTCATQPFTFHPEYATASSQNVVPWAALATNVSVAVETGHFTVCNRVIGSGTRGVCLGPDGGVGEFRENQPCYSGPTVPGCLDFGKSGDLDYDGPPYQADWPDGASTHPTSLVLSSVLGAGAGPVSYNADSGTYTATYPSAQFQTDVAATESTCNTTTGQGCVVPPVGAQFYPFYSTDAGAPNCHVYFGNDISGITANDFGKDAQYGTPTSRFFGDIAGPIIDNPC